MDTLLMFLTALGVLIASYIDFFTRKIPNRLTDVMIVAGLLLNMGSTIVPTVAVLVLGFLLWAFFDKYNYGTIGAGDVKLLTGIAAMIGWTSINVFMYGVVVALPILLIIKKVKMQSYIPIAPIFLIGLAVVNVI